VIWGSTALMTIIDGAIIAMAVTAVAFVVRRRARSGRHGRGLVLTVSGLAVIGIFYLADLLTMWALPLLIPRADAMDVLRDLHLNYSWIANLLGVGGVFAGLAIVLARFDSAADALHRSEARYRTLFEHTPVAIWEEDLSDVLRYLNDLGFREIQDFESYLERHPEVVRESVSRVEIKAVNRQALALHEAADESQLLAGLSAVFTEETYSAFKQELLAIRRGDTQHESQARVKTLDGSAVDVILHWQVAPGQEETLSRVFVTLTDISDRVRAEEELRALNRDLESRVDDRAAELKAAVEELERLFALSVDLICIADIDGRFRKLNPAWTAALGYTEKDLLGVSYLHLVHPDDREPTLRVIRERFALGEPVINFENRCRHEDGSYRWFMWTSRPDVARGLHYAIGRDVTSEREAAEALHRDHAALEDVVAERTVELLATAERLQVEIAERNEALEKLREVSERLRLNVDRMPIAHILWDAGGRVIDWNQAAERIFGFSKAEAVGRDLLDLIVPDDVRAEVAEVTQRILAGEEAHFSGTNSNICKDGTLISCEWFNNRIQAREDGPVTGVSMAMDVTERVRAEADLRRDAAALARSNAELRSLNRLAVGRELRMIELKRQVNELLEEAGKPPAYDTSFAPNLPEEPVP